MRRDRLCSLYVKLIEGDSELTRELETIDDNMSPFDKAQIIREEIIPLIETIREITDRVEKHVSHKNWPIPSNGDLLFSSMYK